MKTEALVFKALSDPTRLRVAALLAATGEVCVCNLADALQAQGFKISKHLAVLRAAGIVETRREGTWMYYRLAAPRSGLQRRLFEALRRDLKEHATVKADLARLSRTICGVR